MTIRRAKPIARSRLKQRKGAKAERETPALDAFRFAVEERARGFCAVMVAGDVERPFPFYDRITRADREMICGKDYPHDGDNAHHVWPEDRDAGQHDPDRGLWLCWRAHRWTHDNPGDDPRIVDDDGEPLRRTAKNLGLMRPVLVLPPSALWYQARAEYPADPDGVRQRYLDLMREHGHIVEREPGDDSPIFPCGYDPSPGDNGEPA